MQTPDSSRSSALRRWVPRLMGLAILGLLFAVQWPVLVGVVRGLSGAEPRHLIAWRTDLDAALAEARAADKPVLVDFTATWCPPCQVMERDAWSDDAVADLANTAFIPVQLDLDTPAGQRAARRYGVEYIPTIHILDPTGEIRTTAGFLTARDARAFLQNS